MEHREVIVYSRKGCHLCEIVKESLVKLHKRGGFQWREVDVDSDAELRRQYNDQVPVVFINGRKAFMYRMDEQEFLRKLASLRRNSCSSMRYIKALRPLMKTTGTWSLYWRRSSASESTSTSRH